MTTLLPTGEGQFTEEMKGRNEGVDKQNSLATGHAKRFSVNLPKSK